MKKVSCNVVQDLIPLYVEDMLSDDSKKLVECHLDECQECQEYLKELQTIDIVPIETNSRPLEKIRFALKKKKWLTILFSVLVTLLVGVLAAFFVTAPEYLPYSEDVVLINETSNGIVFADFDEKVAGYDMESYLAENGEGTVFHLTSWGTSWHELFETEEIAPLVLNPSGESVAAVYYYQTDGSEDQLISGEDMHPNGGVRILPRLSLSYYFGLAMIVLLICIGLMIAVRSNKIYLNRMLKITFLPLSYLLAQLIVTGWNTSTYSGTRDFLSILLVSILLYGLSWIGMEWVKSQMAK